MPKITVLLLYSRLLLKAIKWEGLFLVSDLPML